MVTKTNGAVPYSSATLRGNRGNSNTVMSECPSDGTSLEDAENLSELLSAEQISRLSNTTSSLSQPVCVVSNNTNSKPGITIPVSILIESLVKNICSIYEADPNKASLMYKRICDKLYSMNLLSESYSMTEFEGIRSQYQRALLHLLSSAKNGNQDNVPVKPKWLNSEVNSHYRREFDEVEFIAGGGFGQVYRVKHKLDGTEYAIKKIPIRSEGIQSVRNYLSEVKTFASMNHANIVQYKGAWLEIGAPSHRAISDKHGHEDLHETNNTQYIYHESQSFTEESKHEDTSTDFQIDFEHSVSGASHTKSHRSNKRKKRHSLSEGEGDASMCKLDLKEIERIRMSTKSRVRWATLYIQMALCQSTLKQWLEKRNAMVTDPDKALVQGLRIDAIKQILIQLLSGLEYIHSKGVVHHDIKPSNIFIQIENNGIVIQLGDFGLACPLQSVQHSLAFGTKLYAAPEQLAGKCNPKSDMYSLGIVLFELVENFRTDMERVEYITELRKGHIPSKLFVTHPELAQMIRSLVVKNPELRPDTTSLLHTLKSTETQEIEQLKMQLAEKEEEISHLRELLTMHGIKGI